MSRSAWLTASDQASPAGPILPGAVSRIAAAARIAGFVLCALAWLALCRTPLAAPLRKAGLGALLRAVGIEVVRQGQPDPAPGTLLVANHISWTDIAVLASLSSAGFVAKSEVAGWPLLGSLARRAGCVFVARHRPRDAARQAGDVRMALGQGRSLVLFAEGTTGPGTVLLPFRSSLFPGNGTLRVQPVTIRYRRGDGTVLTPEELRRIAWLGDDELVPHVAALAGSGRRRAEVWFGESFLAADRKQAAARCQAAIAGRLAEPG